MIPSPLIADIQASVSASFCLDPSDMQSQRRARCVARPRQLAMFLARALTRRSLPEIGRAFGARHHSTVVHAVRVMERRLATEPGEAEQARRICARIGERVASRQVYAAREVTEGVK